MNDNKEILSELKPATDETLAATDETLAANNANHKKISQRPAEVEEQKRIAKLPNADHGKIVSLNVPDTRTLTTHADGYPMHYCPHPSHEGTFALFDGLNRTVGVVFGGELADMICESMKLMTNAIRLTQNTTAPDSKVEGNVLNAPQIS